MNYQINAPLSRPKTEKGRQQGSIFSRAIESCFIQAPAAGRPGDCLSAAPLFQQRAETAGQNAQAILLRHRPRRAPLPVADARNIDERSGRRALL